MSLHSYPVFVPIRLAAALLPRTVLHLLAGVIGAIAFGLMPRTRTRVRHNLTLAGSNGRGDTLRTFIAYARVLADHAWMATAPPARVRRLFRGFDGRQNLLRLLEHPQGSLVVSAHLGNWELGGTLIASESGTRPTAAVVLHDPGGRIIHYREEARRRHRVGTIYLNTAGAPLTQAGPDLRSGTSDEHRKSSRPEVGNKLVSRAGALEILDLLRKGGFILMLADRNYTGDGVWVKFMGQDYFFPDGPARIARALDVPLVTATCILNDDGSYTAAIGPPIRGLSITDLSQSMASSLEESIRRHPHQWFNFTREPGNG